MERRLNKLCYLLSACILSLLPIQAAGKTVLRLTSWDGDQGLTVLRKSIAGFEKEHPQIKVRLENIPFNLYFQKLLTQYAANVAPDVAMLGFENFQQYARRGALLPLDEFIRSSSSVKLKDYYEPIVKAHRYQGRLYVLPRDIATEGLIYYNKRLFDLAGIPYPDGSWTWDYRVRDELKEKDFFWVVRQLTRRDSNKKVTQWGFTPSYPRKLAETLALSTGARYADDYESATKLTYASPQMIEAYKWTADLMFDKMWVPSPDAAAELHRTTLDLFMTQKVAMFQGGIWEVPNLRSVLVPGHKEFFEYDITLFPAHKTGKRVLPTGGAGYGIMSSTSHPKEAWMLVSYLAGPKGLRDLAESGLAQPAIRSIALSASWLPDKNTPLERKYPFSRIVTDESVHYAHFAPTTDTWPELSGTLLYPRADDIWLTRGKEIDMALLSAQKEAQNRLDQIRSRERTPSYNWLIGGVLGSTIIGLLLAWIYLPERKIKYTHRQKQESRSAYRFIACWVFGMLVFTLGPMVLSLLMSLADWDIIQPAKWVGAANYQEAFTQDPRFWIALRVTLVYTLFSVPLGLAAALMLALLLNQKIRGVPIFRAIYYLPSLTSLVAASLVWQHIFGKNGLLNMLIYGPDGKHDMMGIASFLSQFAAPGDKISWLGTEQTALPSLIIMSLWGVGGGMVILLAGLQGIPQHYYEAAVVDGAGPWHRFRAVTLPLLTPTIFFSLVTGVIGSFQVFTQAFVMTNGGPNDSTRFFMLHLYNQAFTSLRMGYASALAWVLFLIVLVFTVMQFRLSRWVYYEGDTR